MLVAAARAPLRVIDVSSAWRRASCGVGGLVTGRHDRIRDWAKGKAQDYWGVVGREEDVAPPLVKTVGRMDVVPRRYDADPQLGAHVHQEKRAAQSPFGTLRQDADSRLGTYGQQERYPKQTQVPKMQIHS